MASANATIKIEQDDAVDDFRSAQEAVDTTSPPNGSPTTRQHIKEEDLQILSPNIAAKRKYPPGCKVSYDLTASSTRLHERHGVVKSIYMDAEGNSQEKIYRLEITEGNETSERLYHEFELAFAIGCPVTVKGVIENEPDKEFEGFILCPKPGRGDRKLSYSVRFSMEDNLTIVEVGVEFDHIKYRKVEEHQEQKTTPDDTLEEGKLNTTNLGHEKGKAEGIDIESKAKEQYTQKGTIAGNDQTKPITNNGGNQSGSTNAKGQVQKLGDHTQPAKTTHLHGGNIHQSTNATERPNVPNTLGPGSTLNEGLRPANTAQTGHNHSNKLGTKDAPYRDSQPKSAAKQIGESTSQPKDNIQQPAFIAPPKGMDPFTTSETPSPKPPPALTTGLISTRKWEPPSAGKLSSPRNQNVYCMLTVPLWVTESNTNKSIFCKWHMFGEPSSTFTRNFISPLSYSFLPVHIIGQEFGKERGYKTNRIEQETGCSVDISKTNPVTITIKSMHGRTRFDMTKAREMIEDSLLEFLDCHGARARLLCELAVLREGASHLGQTPSGTVEQRRLGSNKILWHKILDLPALSKYDLAHVREDVDQRLYRESECLADVYGQGDNLKLSAEQCKPFVLIRGKGKDEVEQAVEIVARAINEFQQRRCIGTRPNATSQGKRKADTVIPHNGNIPTERPSKMSKAEATCILTVPLWLMKRCTHDDDLFGNFVALYDFSAQHKLLTIQYSFLSSLSVHLVGQRGTKRGHKVAEIAVKTKCHVLFSRYNSSQRRPMQITITSEYGSFPGVRDALRMVVDILLEFLGDGNAERRLIYELATTAEGGFNFHRHSDCLFQQECHLTRTMLWMNVLELPSAEINGILEPHGRYLISYRTVQELTAGNGCLVEVYGFQDSILAQCRPYVFIGGKAPRDVKDVSDRISGLIEDHMRGCHSGCRFNVLG